MKLLFLTLFASVPLSLGPSRHHTDLIEHNTVIEPNGKPKFEQVILWERLPATGRYVVREWYLLNDYNSELGVPYKTTDGQWEVAMPTRRGAVKVYSDLYRATRTVYDPERENQKVLDVKYRLMFPKGE